MNMRDIINSISSLTTITEDADDITNAFAGIRLPEKLLPAGTPIYHGTDQPASEWNPSEDPIHAPAWFGLDAKVAIDYAKYARSGSGGDPYYIECKTTAPLNLLDLGTIETGAIFQNLIDNYTTSDIATCVLRMGYDGWYIQDEEIMIGHEGDFEFVATHALEAPKPKSRRQRGQ
jgi:hypothetical protein